MSQINKTSAFFKFTVYDAETGDNAHDLLKGISVPLCSEELNPLNIHIVLHEPHFAFDEDGDLFAFEERNDSFIRPYYIPKERKYIIRFENGDEYKW